MEENTLVIVYSLTGRTKRVAGFIHEAVKGDFIEVELEKPYSKLSSFTKGLVNIAGGSSPKIKNEIDFSKYTKIYIGAPTWYFTVNPVMAGILRDNDFSGKEIYPFYTNEGARGNSDEKMKKLAPNSTIHDALEITFVNNKSDEDIKKAVESWVK